MAKERTLGQRAKSARDKAVRRVNDLKGVIESKTAPTGLKEWARKEIRTIEGLSQRTRRYNKSTGKRYKKTDRYVSSALQKLEIELARVPARYKVQGNPFTVTTKELNRASVKAASSYTQTQTKIFYAVTQKIWQKDSIDLHQRNAAIVEWFNTKRIENGLSPMSLEQIVDFVLDKAKRIQDGQQVNTQDDMDEEQRRKYEEAQQRDEHDEEKQSPTEDVVQKVIDAYNDLFELPDPSEYEE